MAGLDLAERDDGKIGYILIPVEYGLLKDAKRRLGLDVAEGEDRRDPAPFISDASRDAVKFSCLIGGGETILEGLLFRTVKEYLSSDPVGLHVKELSQGGFGNYGKVDISLAGDDGLVDVLFNVEKIPAAATVEIYPDRGINYYSYCQDER